MITRVLIVVLIWTANGFGNPYTELNKAFKRTKSRVTVREIQKPTLANLDFAAYDRNPLLLEASKGKPKKTPSSISMQNITFDNLLLDVKDSLSETPVTLAEREVPLAWKPLIKKLWNIVKDDKLQQLGLKIASYKWDDPDIYIPYQEITTVYLHEEKKQTEIWVKVEFAEWISFLNIIQDEDGDGFREIYGKLNLSAISPDSLQKAYNWIKNEYTAKTLNTEEAMDWITDLASYWYPTKNTDIMEPGETVVWPLSSTNKKVRKELHGQKFEMPFAVVEGKPVSPDKPIYNVYLVNTKKRVEITSECMVKEQKSETVEPMDTSLSENYKTNCNRFKLEVSEFGSYEDWYKKNSTFFDGVFKWISSFPAEQMGLEGMDGWLFFRKSFEYMFGKNYSHQASEKNPVPHLVDFKNYLEDKNVNLLFVVVPNKEEVYFDKIDSGIPSPEIRLANPYSRQILNDIQNAGVEVIDLLPLFLKARNEDAPGKEYIYQQQDTHWTNRGLQIAAELISNRIKAYSWYNCVEKKRYNVKDTVFERLGDIAGRLPEQNRLKYPAVKLQAQQVYNEDSTLYKGKNLNAPVMLIGDSFTGVFESVDCKGAGVGSHIAQKTGIPVEIITSWGGGPLVRKKAMRSREKNLWCKRLVIYMMVARDLYNYAQNWEKFPQ